MRISATLLLFALWCFALVHGQGAPYVITQPAKGAEWLITKTYDIVWETILPTPSVSVYLIRTDTKVLVEYYKANNNHAKVTVDNTILASFSQTYDDWQVLVEDAQYPAVNATSQHFSIIYPEVKVSTPSTWVIDENQVILYSITLNNTLVDRVSIVILNPQNNTGWTLAANETNTGVFTWRGVWIGWLSPEPYVIRVCWVLYSTVCGYSSPLVVAAPQFNITTPHAVSMGGALGISWAVEDVVQSASVWLQVPCAGPYLLCGNVTTSLCKLQPIPYWLYQDPDYAVKICWDKYPSICQLSNKISFLAAINMLQDNFGSPILVNGLYNITWTTSVPVSYYTITLGRRYSLFSGGEDLYEIYRGNIQNRYIGSYVWNSTLPTQLTPPPTLSGQVYFLKLSYYVQNDLIYGISNMFSFVNKSNLANIIVNSPTDISATDTAHVTWKISTTKQNNATLPYVSIFLISNNNDEESTHNNLIVANYPSDTVGGFTWSVPDDVSAGAYSWRVCFSSGLLYSIKCGESGSFKLSRAFKLTKTMIIYGAAGIVALLLVIIMIVLCVRRCRSKPPAVLPPHENRLSERSPLLVQSEPSAPDSTYLCKICYEHPLEIMLLPCDHYCLCVRCSNDPNLGNLCPVCKAPIQEMRRVYVP